MYSLIYIAHVKDHIMFEMKRKPEESLKENDVRKHQ